MLWQSACDIGGRVGVGAVRRAISRCGCVARGVARLCLRGYIGREVRSVVDSVAGGLLGVGEVGVLW